MATHSSVRPEPTTPRGHPREFRESQKYFLFVLKLLALFAFLVSAFFAGRLFEQWSRLDTPPITKATTTPTPYIPPLPEGGAYLKCINWDDYRVECYLNQQYEKTTELEGASMDVFVTKKGVKELENHGDFEIYYVKKK